MFAVTTVQSQTYLPVTHILSSAFGSRRCSSRNQKQQKRHSNKEKSYFSEEIICSDSFEEVFRKTSEINLRLELNKETLKILLSKNNLRNSRHSHWKTSYICSSNFLENKYGFPIENLTRPEPFSKLLLPVQNPFLAHLQFATFKTHRSSKVTPLGTTKLSRSDDQGSIVDKFLNFKFRKDEKLATETDQNEKLKTLIAESNLPPEERQIIKVAFAEGYLVADSRSQTGKKTKITNAITNVLGLLLTITMITVLLSKAFYRGPFKFPIGGNSAVHPEEINVTFDDVKGVDEAKQELLEVVEFLRNPEKFSVLGGKLPKGVLLVGPPGTGKTLLARAVAGEADVPFFHAAGPEFDEVLVGQGARRVRDLFSTAKAKAPCVIFIDEIDSVGAKRTNSVLHPYANQTINQLLSEMDGFRQNEGVIVLGATNRREDLDKALLRPGRFDVEVQVPIPDLKGRKEILEYYLGKIKLSSDVDIDMLARGSTGFTGADIENLTNQAAIRAAIDEADSVSMKYLENARDKVLMGPERRSRIPDDEANLITAYHEGGHALVAYYTKDSHPLHKVTIIPRGPSLGHTAYIPEKERYHVTKSQMLAMMDTMMGGRAAEELIFGPEKITSGASSDLKQATQLATHMVKEWGMSEKVGIRTFDESSNALVVVNDLGPSTSEVIDSEIKRILSESYERAKSILRSHAREHKLLAEALVKYETLDADDVKSLLSKRKPDSSKED